MCMFLGLPLVDVYTAGCPAHTILWQSSVDCSNAWTCRTRICISQHLSCFGNAQAESSQDTQSSQKTFHGKPTCCQIGLDSLLVAEVQCCMAVQKHHSLYWRIPVWILASTGTSWLGKAADTNASVCFTYLLLLLLLLTVCSCQMCLFSLSTFYPLCNIRVTTPEVSPVESVANWMTLIVV